MFTGGSYNITSASHGIPANDSVRIKSATISVDTAVLDYDKSAVISGGTFIGTGSSMMAQSFSSAKQAVIAVRCSSYDNTVITLTYSNAKQLINYSPELAFEYIVLTTPEMQSGNSYTLKIGTQSADCVAR